MILRMVWDAASIERVIDFFERLKIPDHQAFEFFILVNMCGLNQTRNGRPKAVKICIICRVQIFLSDKFL